MPESYEMRNDFKRRVGGFTLIELLVVIAIIALLLAILMPALRRVKDIAKDVICRTNLRTIQLATTLYIDDNEGKMMLYKRFEGLWINQISHYTDKMDKIRYCPSTKVDKSFSTDSGNAKIAWRRGDGVINDDGGIAYGSYGINGWLYAYLTDDYPWLIVWHGSGFPNQIYTKPLNSRIPSITPVFADCLYVDAWPEDTDVCPDNFNLDGDKGNGGFMSRYLMNRHGSHTNVTFVDGHQEAVKLEELWSLKWHAQFQTVGIKKRSGPNARDIYQI